MIPVQQQGRRRWTVRRSTWNNTSGLYVGYFGSGTLNIFSGGVVSVVGLTSVRPDSTSAINFGGSGGTLTTDMLSALPSNLLGCGTIDTRGLAGDFNLVFDGSAVCRVTFGSGGTMTVNMSAASGNGDLGVGYMGAAALTIKNGAKVNSAFGFVGGCGSLGEVAASSGTATVDGANSKWSSNSKFCIGRNGTGILKVTNGGIVSNGSSYVAYYAGSAGTATVDGAGSKWTSSEELTVGRAGSGALNITNGGAASNLDGYVGCYSGSTGTATVDGAGSKWTNSSSLHIGYQSEGTLNIINGGSVSSSSCYVGDWEGSTGMATISGGNSTWTTNGDFLVGNRGAGTVTQTGGTNSVRGTLYLGYAAIGEGTYNLNGGTLLLKALSKSAGSATFNCGGGTLKASGTLSTNIPMVLTGIQGTASIDTAGYPVTLSGQLSGPGGLNKVGMNLLILAADNTYTGLTTVSAGTLTLASTGSLLLAIEASPNCKNLITVSPQAALDLFGTIKVDIGDITASSESWTLIRNSGAATYESSFSLATTDGVSFMQANDVWTCQSGSREWTFTEANGVLSLTTVHEPSTIVFLGIGVIILPYCTSQRRRREMGCMLR